MPGGFDPALYESARTYGSEDEHGGKSGRYERLEERAFDYAFILTQLGLNSSVDDHLRPRH